MAQCIPETAASATELARDAALSDGRAIDGHRRQLAVRHARDVDERHGGRRLVRADEAFRLQQVHLRDEHRRQRSFLPRHPGTETPEEVVREAIRAAARREDVVQVVADVRACRGGARSALDATVGGVQLEGDAVVEWRVHPVDEPSGRVGGSEQPVTRAPEVAWARGGAHTRHQAVPVMPQDVRLSLRPEVRRDPVVHAPDHRRPIDGCALGGCARGVHHDARREGVGELDELRAGHRLVEPAVCRQREAGAARDRDGAVKLRDRRSGDGGIRMEDFRRYRVERELFIDDVRLVEVQSEIPMRDALHELADRLRPQRARGVDDDETRVDRDERVVHRRDRAIESCPRRRVHVRARIDRAVVPYGTRFCREFELPEVGKA